MKTVFWKIAIVIISSLFLESCLFGAGLVEKQIIGDYWLFANGKLDEMSIWNDSNLIVEETVFAVGNNEDFIIAKRHPKDSINGINKKVTFYHLIQIPDSGKSKDLTYEQYMAKRKELNVPDDLDFEIVMDKIK